MNARFYPLPAGGGCKEAEIEMEMNTFLEPLLQMQVFHDIEKDWEGSRATSVVCGCLDSQKAHLFFGLGRNIPWKIVLSQDEKSAKEFYEDYRFYDKRTYFYPAKDLLFFQADIHGNLLLRQRMRVMKALLEDEGCTVVTAVDGCLDIHRSLSSIRDSIIRIGRDSIVEITALRISLVKLGYETTSQVEMPGQFSVRGGIVDIYALTEDNPWRIEFFGDEIDSIRTFDTTSQRSLEECDQITIYPAVENALPGEESSLLDDFPDDTLVLLDEPNRLLETGSAVWDEVTSSLAHRAEKGEPVPEEKTLLDLKELQDKLAQKRSVSVSYLEPAEGGWHFGPRHWITAKPVNHYKGSFELLAEDLKEYKTNGFRVILLSASKTRAERLAKDLSAQGFNAYYTENYDHLLQSGEVMVAHGHAHQGFSYPEQKFVLMTDSDLFGKESRRFRKKKEFSGAGLQSLHDLSVGDYVVHEQYGMGIYRGIETIEREEGTKDYIKIEYKGGDALYIATTQLDSLQKYSGSSQDAKPKLNSLGSSDWKKAKSRVQQAVKAIAKELVELYAARSQKDGYICGPDTVWQREFEELFPYEETPDQLSAIEDTKRDMESNKIMDRLICGDVGYGKTEIALRAAFKEVQESRQVVYLVPTTILAQQHYNTFVERMKDFPVRVDLLCRFRTPAQIRQTLEDLKKGLVDIVIGTHRVLSKDVEYRNLGLLIIDEEQRFGVTHKEKIKQLRKNVDVLTLTATPIPRTLHMSLIGIRDMSILEEPPMDRVPIQTYVMEYEEETVREAIFRELRRGGQVFYVYNRVSDIDTVAARIGSLVPEARVGYAHGQMSKRELEKVMLQFINRELDILVSTTIVETGIDISNANTMIIQDSDRYGLSQLYQLRGRIGRSNRTAYAFLMYKKNRVLKETAEERLAAIAQYSDLGSGFRIAMRDLEIRGAGDLLGASQHGHMDLVGYDLYCKLLSLAVKEEKGEKIEESFETAIDVNMDAYIPDSYILNEFQKLNAYKRIAGITNREECDDIFDELLDRYGEPPRMVRNLLTIAMLRAEARKAYITEIKQSGSELRFVLYENARLDRQGFVQWVENNKTWIKYRPYRKMPGLRVSLKGNTEKELVKEMDAVIKGLTKLALS